jgi:hypothetical protein
MTATKIVIWLAPYAWRIAKPILRKASKRLRDKWAKELKDDEANTRKPVVD